MNDHILYFDKEFELELNLSSKNLTIKIFSRWTLFLTDGALRMLIFLYFYGQGYPPLLLAFLFFCCEIGSLLVIIIRPWIFSNFKIKNALIPGIFMLCVSITCLSLIDKDWSNILSLVWVICCQTINGVGKGLMKIDTESVKELKYFHLKKVGKNEPKISCWPSVLLCDSNILTGIGLLFGSAFLQFLGFKFSLWLIVFCIFSSLYVITTFKFIDIGYIFSLNNQTGFSKTNKNTKLDIVRFFLVGSWYVWCFIALPAFLYSNGWSFVQIGVLVGGLTFLHGFFADILQFLLSVYRRDLSVQTLTYCMAALSAIPLGLFIVIVDSSAYSVDLIILGLVLFTVASAGNSTFQHAHTSKHRNGEIFAKNKVFFEHPDSLGRIFGILLSGLLLLQISPIS